MSTGDEPGDVMEAAGTSPSEQPRSRRPPRSRAKSEHAPARLRHALIRLAAGDRYSVVRNDLMAKFGISQATAERDVGRAYSEIQIEAERERPTLAARIADRVWRLALRAERRRDDALALSAYERLARLVGVSAERAFVPEDGLNAYERTTLNALHFNTPSSETIKARATLEALVLTPAERARRAQELEQEINERRNNDEE